MYVSLFFDSSIDWCVKTFWPKDGVVFGQTLDYQEEDKKIEVIMCQNL